MSDEPEKTPINEGEPVGSQELNKADSSGGSSWAAPALLVLAMIAAVVVLAVTPGESSQQVPTVMVYTPGIPTPTSALPESGANIITVQCQPGLEVANTARVVFDGVRMRQSPGYVSKNDVDDTVHFLQAGDIVNVIGGPQQQDRLCWWHVEHQGSMGWTADHSSDGTLLLAASP
jgi:hypothetical protein